MALLGGPLPPPVARHPRQREQHHSGYEDHRAGEVEPAVVVADGVVQRA